MKSRTWTGVFLALAVGLFCGAILGYRAGIRETSHAGTAGLAEVSSARTSSGRIYFYGNIRQCALPLPIDHPLTASEAIIMDGGLKDSSDGHRITVMRRTGSGDAQMIAVDFTAITHGNPAIDPVLQSDDTIVVPEKLVNY